MKVHLLHPDRDFDFDAALPVNQDDLRQDLELDTVLQAMAATDPFLLDVASKVFLGSAQDPVVIRYRQEVLADALAAPKVIRDLYALAVTALDDRRTIWGYSSAYPTAILSGAINHLTASFQRLKELRAIVDTHGSRFGSPGLTTLFHTVQRELNDEYLEEVSQHLHNLRFRNGPLISMELDRDNSGINFVLRTDAHARRPWFQRLGIGAGPAHSFSVSADDEWGQRALNDIVSRAINGVANAAAQSADHMLSFFSVLRRELGFYVACLNLEDALGKRNVAVCFPDPVAPNPFGLEAANLMDVSLVLQSGEPVVGNHVQADGKRLVVITGANSGGKSTFLRSVGAAQLMMQSGMFVVAQSFRASVSTGIFTHFSREEDPSMTSGRLDEELKRLSAIADAIRPHGLILFNESFSSTNEREGSEIGRQVIRALLDASVTVLIVTHQFDLADSFYQDTSVPALFLRAERDEDGRRRYQLVPGEPLATSFGEDIYARIGGWVEL